MTVTATPSDVRVDDYLTFRDAAHVVLDPATLTRLAAVCRNRLLDLVGQLVDAYDGTRYPPRYLAVRVIETTFQDLDPAELRRLGVGTTADGGKAHLPPSAGDAEFDAFWAQHDDVVYLHDGEEHGPGDPVLLPEDDDTAAAAGRLVLPVALLRDMPDDWQAAFVEELQHLGDTLASDTAVYDVRAQAKVGEQWVEIADPATGGAP